MSSRLPTRRLSRSASTSMASANSRRCSASHATSDWSRLVADALIDASGVRRSWLTAWRSAVRSWSASVSRAATAASACSRRDCRARTRLDRNVRSTRWSSADRWAPRRTRTAVPSAVRSQRSPSNGSVGGSGPELASMIHPSSRLDSSETASSGERACGAGRAGRAAGSGSPMRMPLVRASVPASARACSASRLRLATRSTRTLAPAAAATKMSEGGHVLGVADRERVDRRHEVPVDEQRGADGGADADDARRRRGRWRPSPPGTAADRSAASRGRGWRPARP